MDNPHKNPQRMMKQNQKRRGPQRFQKHGRGGNGGRSLLAQRNTFQQNLDRYLGLAREARSSGDRILAENYFQYAEHYLRSLNEVKVLIELENPKEEASNNDGEVAAAADEDQEGGRGSSEDSESQEDVVDQEALSA